MDETLNAKNIPERRLNDFKLAMLRLKEMRCHGSILVFPFTLLFMAPDIKKAVLRFTKQNIYRFTARRRMPPDRLKVLVDFTGGVGDIINNLQFAFALKKTVPDCYLVFSYRHKELLAPLNIADEIIDGKYFTRDFDVVLAGHLILNYEFYNEAAIEKLAPRFLPILKRGLALQKYAESDLRTASYFSREIVKLGLNRRTSVLFFAGFENLEEVYPHLPLPDEAAILAKLNLTGKKYITVHNGFDSDIKTTESISSKNWPAANWREFARMFKKTFPDILIVQLGAKNSEVFDFADINLVNKTSLAQVPAILKNAALHIDGESGLTHLNRLLGKTSVVIWGPTLPSYFGYAENINLSPQKCRGCALIKKGWACVLHPAEKCMQSIAPARVFEAAQKFLSGKSARQINDEDTASYPPAPELAENDFSLRLEEAQTLPFAKLKWNYSFDVYAIKFAKFLFKARRRMRRLYFQLKFIFSGKNRPAKADKLKILIHINGGIGDAFLCGPMLKKFRMLLPADKAQISVCCAGEEAFDIFFKEHAVADEFINRGYFYKDFDLIAYGCTAFEFIKFDRAKFQKLLPAALPVLDSGLQTQARFKAFNDNDPYTEGALVDAMLRLGLNRIQTPCFFCGLDTELPPQTIRAADKKYIVISYDGTQENRRTRAWPLEHWAEFIKLLKAVFPKLQIIQLGARGDGAVSGADENKAGKTSLRETLQILGGAALYIGGEGGLVYLSRAAGIKAAVLFGPSDKPDFLAFEDNINIAAQNCGAGAWATKSWRENCPLDCKGNDCMSSIKPQEVFNKIEPYIKEIIK